MIVYLLLGFILHLPHLMIAKKIILMKHKLIRPALDLWMLSEQHQELPYSNNEVNVGHGDAGYAYSTTRATLSITATTPTPLWTTCQTSKKRVGQF